MALLLDLVQQPFNTLTQTTICLVEQLQFLELDSSLTVLPHWTD
jgi:hypothetical protein